MTKTYKRIVILAIAFIVVAGAACAAVLSGGCSQTGSTPIEAAKNGVLNTVLDASGIKHRIDTELRSKAGEIAGQFGISQSLVDNAVDTLAIDDWQITTLPANATETGTYTLTIDDITAEITTYDDPSVVTINAYGQSLTMQVPETAQGYVPYVKYLQFLQ